MILNLLTKSNNNAKEGINYIRNLSWNALLNELYSFNPQDESAVFARDSINKYALACFPNSANNWFNDVKANIISDSNLSEYKKRELIDKVDTFQQYSDALECWNDASILVRSLNELDSNPSISAIADKVLMNPDKYKENLYAFGDEGENIWAELEESFGLMDRAFNSNNIQQNYDNNPYNENQNYQQIQSENYNSYINSQNLANTNTPDNFNNSVYNNSFNTPQPEAPMPAVKENRSYQEPPQSQNQQANNAPDIAQIQKQYNNQENLNNRNFQQQYFPVNRVERNNVVENLKNSSFSWDNSEDSYSPSAFEKKDYSIDINNSDNNLDMNVPRAPKPAVKEQIANEQYSQDIQNQYEQNIDYNQYENTADNYQEFQEQSLNQNEKNEQNNIQSENQYVSENIDDGNQIIDENSNLDMQNQNVNQQNIQVNQNSNDVQNEQIYDNSVIQNDNININSPNKHKDVLLSKFDSAISYLDKSDDILNLICTEQDIPKEKHPAYSLVVDLGKFVAKSGNKILENWNQYKDYFQSKGIDKQAFVNLINDYQHDAQKQEMALNNRSVGGYFETMAEENKEAVKNNNSFDNKMNIKQNDIKNIKLDNNNFKSNDIPKFNNKTFDNNVNKPVANFKQNNYQYHQNQQPKQYQQQNSFAPADMDKFNGIDIGMMMEQNNQQNLYSSKHKQSIKDTVSKLVKSIVQNEQKQKPKIKQMVEVDKFENIKKQIEKNSAKFNANNANYKANDEVKRGRGRPRKEEIHQAKADINNEMSNLSINELQNIMAIVKQMKNEKVA